MDILKSYLERPTDTHQGFDEVASTVSAETRGGGIADAFRSDRTPDFDIAWSNIASAQELEVSPYTFIAWRTGRPLPEPFQLERLADHLCLSSQF